MSLQNFLLLKFVQQLLETMVQRKPTLKDGWCVPVVVSGAAAAHSVCAEGSCLVLINEPAQCRGLALTPISL